MRQDGAVVRRAGDVVRGGTTAPADRHAGGLAGLRDGLRDLFGQAAPGGRLSGEAPGAPAAVTPGPEELRKQRVFGMQRWYAGAVVGLLFLVYAMVQAALNGGSVAEVIAYEALAVVFGAIYVLAPVRVGGGFAGAPSGWAGRAGVLLAMLAVSVPMIMIGGVGVSSLWIYIGVVAAIQFPLRTALAIAVALAGGMLLLSGLSGASLPWELALTLVALALWMAGFVGNIRLTIELRTTREELARAAVAAERARIGRDLHDILGHSLTAIAVKAGLARRLVQRDAGSALTEISDVERLAREALADVRATAAGYRDVSLAGELAVARSVLQAAGIVADLPSAVDDVDPRGRGVFGYVVREAVTNVLRHSGAGRCAIELDHDSVRITDDGRGGPPDAGPGSGLRGLAERLSAVGGILTAGPLAGGGFRVTATLLGAAAGAVPGAVAGAESGPASAAAGGPVPPDSVTAVRAASLPTGPAR